MATEPGGCRGEADDVAIMGAAQLPKYLGTVMRGLDPRIHVFPSVEP
jgi:hypothetical protein